MFNNIDQIKKNDMSGAWDTYTEISVHNIPIAVCVSPPEDEQVVLETCTGC
jgi:hypothetical protein